MILLRGETLEQVRKRIEKAKRDNVRELEALQTEALVEILAELRSLRHALLPPQGLA